MRVLSVVVGIGARTGGIAPFVGGAARELEAVGAHMQILGTDLALAPWGWSQRQRRIRPDEWHPALANTDTQLFKARFPRRLAYSPALARRLRQIAPQFDLIHIHNLWQFPQYAAHRAAFQSGVPYIVSPHGGLDPYLRRRGRLRKQVTTALWQGKMLDKARMIHVTTQAEKALTADVAPAVPRAVVPCGLDVDEFAALPESEVFRRRQLDGYDGPLVLFLGRITQKKGLDVLIRAFNRARQDQECRLAIVGPDDEGLLPKLHEMVAELGLERDVYFLEPAYGEDRLAALASADVWALPSHAENFGIAVVEAMAAGCPVLISPAVNLSPEIAGAQAGIVAEADPEIFGQALAGLLGDHPTRQTLRQRAPAFARHYDWNEIGPQLIDMYARAAAIDAVGAR
jgi:glycosyltransferase involved in cell wall biosynthesis